MAFMSGNTTQTGSEIGKGNFGPAFPAALAIFSFVTGSFAGAFVSDFKSHRARRIIFAAAAVLLALVIGLSKLGAISAAAHIAVASFAMGVLNTAFSRVGAQHVGLTFVTGTLSRFGVHLAYALRRRPLPDSEGPWDTHLRRALLLGGIWMGFLVGALLSGVATQQFGVWVLLFPILVLALLAALA
ncbi:MAG: DUF1275 family protein [Rhodomicrobium sp.]